MTKFLKTTETATSTNYPYGYLKCTATWSLEYKEGKGFRVVFQTINPKTNRLNAPKKSTYSPLILLTQDENGFVNSHHFNFQDVPEINKAADLLTENFDLFTPEQIKGLFGQLAQSLRASWYAVVRYCGANEDNTKELFTPALQAAIRGFKNGENTFKDVKIDADKYNALRVPDYQPFKIVTYE